ncbi:uncharacterized protein Tco025E_03483 [Trypanosoma conorhini]|uniref:Uncharacterized protein n=1 Tax=Trypanosoma conorhini TaxID=83891 RepID=A0A3R7MVQ8_9TRYP|nr:uncharacterized protein Tco025E_03483 [Trypanosoma conorhini]RNF21433.1 hypothetical protein Tco025E_03483 [Trypanosoma conorhini]
MPSAASHPPFKSAAFRHGVLGGTTPTATGSGQDVDDDDGGVRRPFIAIAPPAAPSAPAVQRSRGWRTYPSVPFYAMMQGLQLVMNVAAPGEGAAEDLNDAELLNRLPKLQALIQDAVTKYGSTYYLTSLQSSCNPLLYPAEASRRHTGASTLASAVATTELDYWAYLQALQDVFYRFTELRDRCCSVSAQEACTHHVFFVRLTDHPRLKDLMAMLAVEHARLCLCLCASSRVTQQYFTQRAQDVGVELEWVLGSALVTEPERLTMTEVNPVFALWDVFVNLPLHTTSPTHEVSDAVAAMPSPDGVVAERFMRNVSVTLVSSLRFAGSAWSAPALRLCEVGLLSEGGRRRLVWSLVATPCIVLPQLVLGLVRHLVEESPVEHFELRFTHERAAGAGVETAGAAGRGVAYVTGASRGVVQRKSASSTSGSSLRAFSRLSAEAWLSDDDRRHYGLLLEDDPVPLECEFTLEALRYCRQLSPAGPATDEELIHPQRWGCGFQMENNVVCVLADEEE